MARVMVLGAADLRQALGVLSQRVFNDAVRPGLRDGAKVLAEAVRSEIVSSFASDGDAPHLADAVKVRAQKRRRRGMVAFVVLTGSREELGIPKTTKSGTPRGYYPAALNFGWAWSRGPGKRRIGRRKVADGTDRGGVSAALGERLRAAEVGTKTVPANPFMERAFARAKEPALAAVNARVRERLKEMRVKAGGGPTGPAEVPA